MFKVFEYKLKPNKKQELLLRDLLNKSRYLYNQGLEELINHYEKTGKHLNRFAHDRMHGKKEHPDMPATVVDTTIVRLHKSFANFFRGIKESKKIGFPRFQSFDRWHSFEFRDWKSGGKVKDNHFYPIKTCKIKLIKSREIEGNPKYSRVIKRPSGWYVQIVCDISEIKIEKKTGDKGIGIDLGLKYFVADSNGNKINSPQFFRKSQEKLAKSQRLFSRKAKGSKRRNKQKHNVARIHEKIVNQRKDFLHKTALSYAKPYDYVVVEDLNIKGMIKNKHLALSISDASWGTFIKLLAEKLETLGGELIKVNPRYTSQKCSNCGAIVKKSLSQRTHYCPECLYVDCRDVNAAKNIFRAGQVLRGAEAIALCDETRMFKRTMPKVGLNATG